MSKAQAESVEPPKDASSSGDTTGPGAVAASPDSALWKRLGEPGEINDMVRAWLALQCQIIEGATHGIVLLTGAKPNTFDAAAHWPEGSRRSAALAGVAEQALHERRGVASGESLARADIAGAAQVAFPIMLGRDLKGVVAISLRGSSDDIKSALRSLQWGSAWICERLRGETSAEQERLLSRSRAALDLLGDALGRSGFENSAMAVVTGLAVRGQCARVSLGVRPGRSTSVKVISHSAQFGQRMVLVSGLAAAMDEALDQRCMVLYPAPPDQLVATNAHAELSRAQRDGQVLTIPMLAADVFVGALTFERATDAPFDQDTIEMFELVTSIVGPILDEKRRNDQWLVVKVLQSLKEQARRLLGPGFLGRKLAVIAIVLAGLFLTFAQGVYKVNADAQIEGLLRRAVVTPYDGFIKDANARAGDAVKEGDLLATLEDRDLLLERLKWVTQRQEHLYEYDKALAARQPAAINVIRSQIDQADAQIKLIGEQIDRITLRSPITGLVVSGDLSQLIGTSVQRGQILFEIAPLDVYRINLDVDEREVRAIEPGQSGELVVSALPTQNLRFTVERVTPIAETRSGRNAFRVEGRLIENPPQLRPGMEGVGKIEIGTRNLAWIWLHPLLDGLRIWSWHWLR